MSLPGIDALMPAVRRVPFVANSAALRESNVQAVMASRLLTFVPTKPPGAGNGSPFCATQASACRELAVLVRSSES
jgi:hypothetical protein